MTLNEFDVDNYEGGKSISAWDSEGKLYKIIQDVAHVMGKSSSDLVKEILTENIEKYADGDTLSSTKRRWIRMRQEQIREGYAQDLAKRQKKRSTFINFVASQIHDLISRGGDLEDARDWLKENEKLFKNRDLFERYEHALNHVGLYYTAYNRWLKANKAGKTVAFQEPPLDAEDSNDLKNFN